MRSQVWHLGRHLGVREEGGSGEKVGPDMAGMQMPAKESELVLQAMGTMLEEEEEEGATYCARVSPKGEDRRVEKSTSSRRWAATT